MPTSKHAFLFASFLVGAVVLFMAPRLAAQQACPGPPPVKGTAQGNIFSERQEMDLGDAVADHIGHEFRVISDEALNAYLASIGERLLFQMPATQMKFQFHLVDLRAVDAFTLPGGRIYVTRKLIAFAHDEDELAGVLAHELGHALTHQPAADISRMMRDVLGVTQVGDRADIFAKYNQFVDNVARKKIRAVRQEKEEEQIVADQYSLYASARAGYSPQALAAFFDRLAGTKGKTGGWFSDLFGTTTPNQRRLRDMEKYAATIPSECIAHAPAGIGTGFSKWQADVIEYVPAKQAASLLGMIWERKLTPPLESELTEVRFSPDGKYLLAQDDFGITLLTREPFTPLFRINAAEAYPAQFSPDSQSVVLWTHGLRVETWSIPEKRRTAVREMALRTPCTESQLSPDGKTLSCLVSDVSKSPPAYSLQLLEVATGTELLEKKVAAPYLMSGNELFLSLLATVLGAVPFACSQGFSPDLRYFAASCGETIIAYDMSARSEITLPGEVNHMMTGGFAFLQGSTLIGIDRQDPKKSGVVTFPSGPVLARIPMRGEKLSAPAGGDYFIVRPLHLTDKSQGKYSAGVVDWKTQKVVMATKESAFDVYKKIYARGRPDGSAGLYDLETHKTIAVAGLLQPSIRQLRASALSSDLKWFADSGRSRGGVWNLETGERIFHVRGFHGAYFGPDDKLYADFPEHEEAKRTIAVLDPARQQTGEQNDITDANATQFGRYLLARTWTKNGGDFEVRDALSSKQLWTKHISGSFVQLTASTSDSFIAMCALDSDIAKQALQHDEPLKKQVEGIRDKSESRLVQVLDAQTGNVRQEFAVDTGKGSFRVERVVPAGRWIVLADNQNRVLIYSSGGDFQGWIFGRHPTVAEATGLLAVETQAGTLEIYDLATLAERERLDFPDALAFYKFTEDGKKLFVLTGDQTARLFDVTEVSVESAAAASEVN